MPSTSPQREPQTPVTDDELSLARDGLAFAAGIVGTSDPIEALNQAEAPPRASKAAYRALEKSEIRASFDAVLLSKHPDVGLDALLAVGALDALLPEVSAMVGFGDGEWRHKDVWLHTKQVVKQAVPRLEVRWGALLHDIGKLKTRRIDERNQVTFYGHSEVGARMFKRKVAARIGLEGALAKRVHFLILMHLRPGQYKASWTDAAVRRFYKQMGEGLKDLLDLGRADITTKRPEKRKRGVKQISLLKKRIEAIREADEKVRPLPKGLGTLIISELGVPPSKELGNLMKRLEADVEAGEFEGGLEADAYIAFLRENAEKYGIPRP